MLDGHIEELRDRLRPVATRSKLEVCATIAGVAGVGTWTVYRLANDLKAAQNSTVGTLKKISDALDKLDGTAQAASAVVEGIDGEEADVLQ